VVLTTVAGRRARSAPFIGNKGPRCQLKSQRDATFCKIASHFEQLAERRAVRMSDPQKWLADMREICERSTRAIVIGG
jgi:hypothetical protein